MPQVVPTTTDPAGPSMADHRWSGRTIYGWSSLPQVVLHEFCYTSRDN